MRAAQPEQRAMEATERLVTRSRQVEETEETEAMWEWRERVVREEAERSPGPMELMARPQPAAAMEATVGLDFPQ